MSKIKIFFVLVFLNYLMIIGNIISLYSNIYSKNNSSKIFNNIKRSIKDKIYKYYNKNISNINSLYIKGNLRFGNYFISLNNAIIFCEIMSCKKIIMINKNDFINNSIFYQKYNIISIKSFLPYVIRNKFIIIFIFCN